MTRLVLHTDYASKGILTMAEIIPREFIHLLLNKIDLVDFINSRLPLRKKSNNNYFACCPFHDEKSASFSVSQTKQFYHCFGCGAHGNAIDFVMQRDKLTFPEAIEALARHTGMTVPRTAGASKKDESIPALHEIANQAAQRYQEALRTAQRAIEYLKNRGISGQIAVQFALGYAPPGWSFLLDKYGKSDSDKKKLLDTGLIIKKDEGGYYDRFRDRIMFPIHDYRGRIIGFGGRIIDQGEPKYLNSPETPLFQKGHELYGLHQALQTNRQLSRVLIVEGYMDVIALFQHGITYAVATLGTATTPHHIQRLLRYTHEIIFCFDGDAAGRTAAWRALQVILPLLEDNLQIRFLFLPEGEDPDTLIRKIGKSTFEQQINTALSLSAFFFQTLAQQCDLNTMEGRARLATLALKDIKQLPQGLLQGILLEELSSRTRINTLDLKQQLGQAESSSQIHAGDFAALPKSKLAAPLRLALALLVQHPRLALALREPPSCSLLGYAFFLQLFEMIKKDPNMSTGMLIEYWRDQKEAAFVSKLAQAEHSIPEKGIESEFLGAIRQITILGYDEEINKLTSKAGQMALSEEEKLILFALIAKKKAI